MNLPVPDALRSPFARIKAVVMKEFVQVRRDRLTLGMMVMMPLIQLLIFGYAINMDPKHLPAVAQPSYLVPIEENRYEVHGNDERLSIENVGWGVRFYVRLLQEAGH